MLTVYMHSLARALLLRKRVCVHCTCELRTTVCVYSSHVTTCTLRALCICTCELALA